MSQSAVRRETSDGLLDYLDRLILVDPYDVNGDPVYKTVRELLNLAPPP